MTPQEMPVHGFDELTADFESDGSETIGEYLKLIRRRWRIILAITCLAVAGSLVLYFITPDSYRASTTVQIEQRNLLSFGSDRNPWLEAWATMKYYPTQYLLLESRGLAERAVLNLRLMDDSSFNPYRAELPAATEDIRVDAGAEQAAVARLAMKLLGGLTVAPVKDTELVTISYVASTPVLAARIANGVAEAFIDWGIETRRETVDNASSFLEGQIDSLKAEVDEKELQLQNYSRGADIVNLAPESNVTMQRLEQLNQDYTAALGESIQKRAKYNELVASPAEAVADRESGGLVKELERDQLRMERQYETRLTTYKPDWPEMVELKSQIDEGRKNLDRVVGEQAKASIDRAYAEYQTALRRQGSFKAQIDKVKGEALNVNSAAVEYRNLEMEITNTRSLLDDLLRQLSETGVAASLQRTRESNIRVIDRALVPGAPFSPSLRKSLTSGIGLGTLAGIALVLLIHFLDRTVKSAEEVERLLQLPVLTVVPDLAAHSKGYGRSGGYGYGYGGRWGGSKKKTAEAPKDIELLPATQPRSAVSEAYRSLRTALLLSSAEELKVLVVSSAEASEGKTTTAANLAVVLAQLGKRVLLLDADLRKPRLHKVFELSNRLGLVSHLAGVATGDLPIQATSVPNLSLCPAGPHPPNPSELLASERMGALIQRARMQFDFVIIDTPPVLAVTDAILVGDKADGVVLCLRAHKILREDVKACRATLDLAEVRILGAVLNRYHPNAATGYGRRYSYYEAYAEDLPESATDSAA